MLRHVGITVRLNILVTLVAAAMIGLIAAGYVAINGQLTTQQEISRLNNARAAAQTVQFDFSDFNGWQTAYAFDINRLGVSAASDRADSRKAFLASVARTRRDVAALQAAATGLPVDPAALGAVSTGVDTFMATDNQVIAEYRRGDLASRKRADGLVLGQEITIYNAAAGQLNAVADRLAGQAASAAQAAAASGRQSTWVNIGVGAGVIVVVVAVAMLIARSIGVPLRQLTSATARLAAGDFDVAVDATGTDEPGRALAGLDSMKSTLTKLIDEMNQMAAGHDLGDIDVVVDAARFPGGYQVVAQGVNDLVNGHIAVKKKAMTVVKAFGEGDFDAPLELFPGKKAFINETVEQVRANLRALIADTSMLSQAAVEGRLDVRADAGAHHGGFRSIVQGINATLDAVIGPLTEVNRVLSALEEGDLTQRITTQYAGRLEAFGRR